MLTEFEANLKSEIHFLRIYHLHVSLKFYDITNIFKCGQGPEVVVEREEIEKSFDDGNNSLSASEDTSLSDTETEIIVGIPDLKNMEEVETSQLLD